MELEQQRELAAFMGPNAGPRHAVDALLMLATLTEKSPRPVTLAQLAAALPEEPSVSHLELIFMRLRKAGLVDSVRGALGGFQIPRPLNDITLAEVVRAMGGPPNIRREVNGPGVHLWQLVAANTARLLEKITLHNVCKNKLPPLPHG